MSAAPAVVLAHAGTDDRRMYAEYLRAHGFSVHEAETTDAALELIENCQLVITGLMVPGSIGGVDLIARIRQEHSAVPIIVVTACVVANVLDAARTAGCDELLIKPCFPEHLLESVRRLLDVPPAGGQHASSR